MNSKARANSKNISVANNCGMKNLDLDALECLATIVEEGAFERAAVRLSITQSAVSQRLRTLEAQAGTVLLVRSRPLRPTSAGRLLIKHAMQMRLLRADLDHHLQELTPGSQAAREEDRISIAINADSIATWALPALGPLVRAGLPLEIIADDQNFTQEWLREGQVLGCITTLKQALRGCKVLPLGDMHYVAVASADFARAHCPQGLQAGNFRRIPFIAFNRKDELQTRFVARALGLRRVSLVQRFVPSAEGQLQAVLAGWGASVVPHLQAHALLARGDLVNLAAATSLPVSLYWHCWNLDSAAIDSLTQALLGGAQAALQAPALRASPGTPVQRKTSQAAKLTA